MRWKKWFWSGLGGALMGAGAIFASRYRRRKKAHFGRPEPIPEDVEGIEIETEELELRYRDEPYFSRAVYHCSPTPFRVWSLLQADSPALSGRGRRIFYVQPEILFRAAGQDRTSEKLAEERFYATLHVYSPLPGRSVAAHIARGQLLEFRKCHVGGSMNGVETGDKIVTMAPVASFQILQKVN